MATHGYVGAIAMESKASRVEEKPGASAREKLTQRTREGPGQPGERPGTPELHRVGLF